MGLVQLSLRGAEVLRQERSTKPIFEFHLEENQRIVGVWHHWVTDHADRATVDHHVQAWVETRL